MKKELDYSPLFQFVGKSAEVSLFLPNLHSTFDYHSFRIEFRDEHLCLSDRKNDLIWTLITYDDIKDIVYHKDSEVVDIILAEGFISVCEESLRLVDFEINELEFE